MGSHKKPGAIEDLREQLRDANRKPLGETFGKQKQVEPVPTPSPLTPARSGPIKPKSPLK